MNTMRIFQSQYNKLSNIRLQYHHFIRRLQNSRELIIIGSAHKVGSTWVYGLLKDLCALKRLPLPPSVLQSHPTKQSVDIDIVQIFKNIQVPNGGFIYKSHSYPPPTHFVSSLDLKVKFVTVIRDPRDVIISASFYLARLPQEQGGWGEEFANLTEMERIFQVIKKGDFIISRLREWFKCPYAHKIIYENLLTDGVEEIEKVLYFLDLTYNENTIKHFYKKHSFDYKYKKQSDFDNKKIFLRKGVSGDWKNYFTKDCKKIFKFAQNGEWNNLLTLFGYEKNLDW